MKQLNFEKQYNIENWTDWNISLTQALIEFKNQTGMLPSYIIANEHTHSQIDFLVNITEERQHVHQYYSNSTQKAKNKAELIRLTHFIFEKQFIDFVFDNTTCEQSFVLAYDTYFENEKATEAEMSKSKRLAVA